MPNKTPKAKAKKHRDNSATTDLALRTESVVPLAELLRVLLVIERLSCRHRINMMSERLSREVLSMILQSRTLKRVT